MAHQLAGTVALAEDEIASGLTAGLFDAHSGIAFVDEADQPKIVHLGWHRRVYVDAYAECANWLVHRIDLPAEIAAQLTGLLCACAKQYGQRRNTDSSFEYGLNALVGADSVGWDGTYSPTEQSDGYTCSTFVAALLEKVGFKLVDMTTWPRRDEDKLWGKAIICMLRATGASDLHVEKVSSNADGLRLRPEELAAGAEVAQYSRPAIFKDVYPRAAELLNQVRQEYGLPGPPPPSLAHCIEAYRAGLEELARGQEPKVKTVVRSKRWLSRLHKRKKRRLRR